MSAPSLLDKTYNVIIKRLIETGQAPHFTEMARELGISAWRRPERRSTI